MKDSAIEWTDHTFNPWIGCTKVDELCAHCYAETLDQKRMSKTLDGGTPAAPVSHWGPGAPRHRTSVSYWKEPRKWNREAAPFTYGGQRPAREADAFGWRPHRPRVFCASLADWLDDEVPIEWLADLLLLIHETPNLTWQLLTKRPENFAPRINSILEDWKGLGQLIGEGDRTTPFGDWLTAWRSGRAPANVWFGVSAGTQKGIEKRIPVLHTIPAVVRFLSCEPMLEFVELYSALKVCAAWPGEFRGWRDAPNARVQWSRQSLMPTGWRDAVDWVICGGESTVDPKVMPRPLHPHWAQCLRDQCAAAGVPFFFKQWGDWVPYDQGAAYMDGFKETRLLGDGHVKASGWPVYLVGKKNAGAMLDGREHRAFPEVRQ